MSQYLILHKVRGEPAFDIAERTCPGPRPCQPNCGCWDDGKCIVEDEWIISTSGHRAYPYWNIPLNEVLVDDYDGVVSVTYSPPAMPKDWPDHYNVTKEHSGPKLGLTEVMSMVMPKLRRRI